jgi:small subunit ribosomal protein S9
MAELVQYYGTGRRKSSVARVFLRPGSGEFTVNGKPFDVYFVTEAQRIMAKSALVLTETSGSFNIVCTVDGGGVNGQSGAVRMGVARALQEFNPELRRGKERKKYGQKGARKRFQFSKR